jgi:hypothetical protein
MTNRPLGRNFGGRRRGWFGSSSSAQGRRCFGSPEIKKHRIPTDFFSCCDWPHMRTTVRRKKPVMKLRLNIKCLSMWLSPRFGPAIRDAIDVNLAAFTSAFGFARHSVLWHAPSNNLSRSRQALSGIGIFSGQNEGTRCISFFSQSPCCRYLFPPVQSLRIHVARRRSRRPVPAMCSATAVQ